MRIFIFGATGATGTVLVPMARAEKHDVPFHVRPASAGKSELSKHADAHVFELDHRPALTSAIANADLVVSLVGTMRSRFKEGDTYESSDIGSARRIVEACEAANVPRMFLLSSFGAGGTGAYLQMKGECERIVRESKLAWTIFRPSALVSPKGSLVSAHGTRDEPPLLGAAMKLLGHVPGLHGWSEDVAPIGIDVLCRAMLRAAREIPAYDRRILSGRDLVTMGA